MPPASDLKTSSIDLVKWADINNGIEVQETPFPGTVRIEHLEALLARHFGHLRPSVKLWIGGGSMVEIGPGKTMKSAYAIPCSG